jgi:hypothetical protein
MKIVRFLLALCLILISQHGNAQDLPSEAAQEISRYKELVSKEKTRLIHKLQLIQDKITKQGNLDQAIAVRNAINAINLEEDGSIVDVIVTKDRGSIVGYKLIGKWGEVNGQGDDVFMWAKQSREGKPLTDIAVYGRSGAPRDYKSCGFVWDCNTSTDAWGAGSEWACGIVATTAIEAPSVKDVKISTKPILEGYEARGNFNGLTLWIKR